jgi:polyferredoxin
MTPSAWADVILVLHAAFVLFVVGGLVATWAGIAANRAFARNPWFRGLHLAAIGIVVAEALLGYMCPLTIWEDMLRGTASGKGFIQRWVHAWLFWDWPAWAFTTLYVAFGAMVAATWFKFPPRGKNHPPPPQAGKT